MPLELDLPMGADAFIAPTGERWLLVIERNALGKPIGRPVTARVNPPGVALGLGTSSHLWPKRLGDALRDPDIANQIDTLLQSVAWDGKGGVTGKVAEAVIRSVSIDLSRFGVTAGAPEKERPTNEPEVTYLGLGWRLVHHR